MADNYSELRAQVQLALSRSATTFVVDPSILLELVEENMDLNEEVHELERAIWELEQENQQLVDELAGDADGEEAFN